jgi:hypothetical protein
MKCSIKTMETIRDLMITEYKEQVLQRGDGWIDELEHSMREELVALGNAVLGEVLSSYDEQVNRSTEKCECGGRAKRQLRREARILSVFGWVKYKRGYYHCNHCGKRDYRLDASQGLRAGQASRGMARLMSMAGVTTSFAEASQQIRDYLLVSVSANTIRKETYAIGRRQAEREAQEREESEQVDSQQRRERRLAEEEALERVYGSIDGAQAPTMTGWREVKNLAWYQSRCRYGHPDQLQATKIEYRSEITPAEEFGRLLWSSALSYQADHAQELVFVCDGAAWIWKLVEQYFPEAVQIVDWYHACGYLTGIASTAYADQDAAQDWLERMKTWLWKGKLDAVLAACREHEAHPQASEFVAKAITYYTNNCERMDYPAFRERGYFCGSGTVESACKQIVTARLKKPGARWLPGNATLTAKARAAYLSGTQHWRSLFELPLAA